MAADEKFRLRRELRQRRQALTPAQRAWAASAVVDQVRRCRLWRHGRRWAFYLPFASEFDCRPLMAAAQSAGRRVYLPVVRKGGVRRMAFVALGDVRGWKRSRLGMVEPVARRFVSARRLDVVCLPLLGFDATGGRLGQGGGYYDATFAFRRHGLTRPRLFGLAFACQQVEQLPVEPWDVRLDAVVTEKGVLTCVTG